MARVQVRGEILRWARERARLPEERARAKFPKLLEWESGETKPTLKQLESFASFTHVPFGFLFLQEPPVEQLPIPDFRTMHGQPVARPSPDLLDMIYACQNRQVWFREYALANQVDSLPFVGSATIASDVVETAAAIRQTLGFDLEARAACKTWEEALKLFVNQADSAGVLVMRSGIVMNNTRRALDPKEFRGFALADDLAPLVFINGADSKSAQMFTLAHELAHLWLGQSALSDTTVASQGQNATETWCNKVAAEMLAPLAVVQGLIGADPDLKNLVARLVRRFKVSTLVVLQRLRDAGRLNWNQFNTAYAAEVERIAALPKPAGGGDFYASTATRYSKRFARALVSSTLEGRTLYGDAFRLLGISKPETFQELGRSLQFQT